MSTIWGFDHIEDKHTLYGGKDCMKKFCVSLREESENAIDFEKRKMLPLTKGELKSHLDGKAYYLCQKRILKKFADDKNYRNVRKHCHYASKYRGATHSICNLKFNMPNEIPVVFHNGSNYDFILSLKN